MSRLLPGVFASSGQGYLIDGSTRFDPQFRTHLKRRRLFNANRQTFTFSVWIKHDQQGTSDYSFLTSTNRSNSTWFIDPNYQLCLIDQDPRDSSYPVDIRTSRKLRDNTGWYHVMVAVDTTQADEADRLRMYINGEWQTALAGTIKMPERYHRFYLLSDYAFAVGAYIWGDIFDYSGYMTDFYYVDGIALGPNDFLANGLNNQKVPIQYTGDLGKNGFYLPLRTKYKFDELGMNFEDRGVGGDPFFDTTAMLIQATENVGGNNLTITDSSPNNFSITYSGAPGQGGESPFRRNRDVVYDSSLDGQSIHFNGQNGSDCVYIPASSNANIGTGDFTVEFWMKSKVYSTDVVYRRIWMMDGPTQNSSSTNLQILQNVPNGALYVWNGASRVGSISSTHISDNSWHHIAVSRKSGVIKGFVDGIEQFSTSDTTNYTANGGSPRMRVGGYDSSSGRFDGLISNMRVVIGTSLYVQNFDVTTEPLTAVSGTQLLLKESPINVFDATSTAVIGTIGNTAVANDQVAYRPTSIRIPTNSYLRMPSDFLNEIGTGDFCVEMLVRFKDSMVSKNLFGSSNGGGAQPKFGAYTNSIGQLQIDINGGVVLTTAGSAANNWYHFAIVRENGILKVYRGGRLIGSVANSSNISGLTKPFHVGWFGEGSINFDGWIDAFRVTVGNARYYSGFMVPSYQLPETGPKAFYPYGWDWSGYYGDDPFFQSSLYGRYPVQKPEEFTSSTSSQTEEIPNPDPLARGMLLAISGSYLNGNGSLTDVMQDERLYGPATITSSGANIVDTINMSGTTGAIEFDGSSSNYIRAELDYTPGTGDFTIECDLRTTSWFSGSGLFRRIWWWGDSLSNSLSLNVNSSGFLQVRWNDSVIIQSTVTIPQTNGLTHVVVQRSYQTLTLFINEINRGSATFSTNINAAASLPIYFGNASTLNAPFLGYLGNIRMYRVAKFNNNLTTTNSTSFENTSNGQARRKYPYAFESPTPHVGSDGYTYANFMTMNANNSVNSTISGGGLEYVGPGNSCGAWSTMAIPPTGQWLIDVYDLTGDFAFMLDQNPSIVSNYQAGGTATSLQGYIYGSSSSIVHNGSTSSYTNWSNTDSQRISIFLDMDDNKITVRRNNSASTEFVYTFNSSLKSNPLYFGYKVNTTWPATTRHYYFGESRSYSFSYIHNIGYENVTDGKIYKPICDYNISQELTIPRPENYFDAVEWIGDGVNGTEITDINFSADLVWAKVKSSATFTDHVVGDRNRGTNKTIFTNANVAEQTNNEIGFISDNGFSVGNSARVNQNGSSYVGWAWNVADNAVANNDGSIASSVRVNNDSKVSIVTYTSPNLTADQTVGHGLGSTPKLIIVKNLDTTYNWDIYHHKLGTNASLTFTNGTTRSGAFGSTINNSIFTTKNSFTHAGTNRYVAYCFDEVEGFSQFGKFIGNGSDDGTFVYTGFRPAFIMIKCSSATGSWNIMDYKRVGRNPSNFVLYADTNSGQQGYTPLDILSNGFKLRSTNTGTGAFNSSGGNFIYIAFAESPELGSLAR